MLFALMAAATGCAATTADVSPQALLHHRFVLIKADDANVAQNKMHPKELSFGEGMHVYGAVCSRFRGQGELSGATLRVPELITTVEACQTPEEQKIDELTRKMLAEGVTLRMRGQQLWLLTPQHTLVWQLADLVG
ncbi:heat-inducible protein [Salmonella enterica subsp. enterica serovar Choleraesuis]|nr:heat-inducible protein [Salmonella enterica subsp. enterica serovar Choleraesuis]